jgi:hypothetical protein
MDMLADGPTAERALEDALKCDIVCNTGALVLDSMNPPGAKRLSPL